MEEFELLLKEAHRRGIRIIMDMVLNHTSTEHEWFKKALADPDGEYADYFFFREGKNGNPPSNLSLIFWRQLLGTSSKQQQILFTYVCKRAA